VNVSNIALQCTFEKEELVKQPGLLRRWQRRRRRPRLNVVVSFGFDFSVSITLALFLADLT
jgi:hypothetical protein